MACINCGVITSACVWRNSSRCDRAIRFPANWSDSCLVISGSRVDPVRQSMGICCPRSKHASRPEHALQTELVTEIEPPHVGIVNDVVGAALHQDLSRVDNVGTVG